MRQPTDVFHGSAQQRSFLSNQAAVCGRPYRLDKGKKQRIPGAAVEETDAERTLGYIQRKIRAVLAPAQTDYLYFVAQGGGRHRFSRTFSEHRGAIEQSP